LERLWAIAELIRNKIGKRIVLHMRCALRRGLHPGSGYVKCEPLPQISNASNVISPHYSPTAKAENVSDMKSLPSTISLRPQLYSSDYSPIAVEVGKASRCAPRVEHGSRGCMSIRGENEDWIRWANAICTNPKNNQEVHYRAAMKKEYIGTAKMVVGARLCTHLSRPVFLPEDATREFKRSLRVLARLLFGVRLPFIVKLLLIVNFKGSVAPSARRTQNAHIPLFNTNQGNETPSPFLHPRTTSNSSPSAGPSRTK
jgi:hypothetical protein